MQVFPIVHGKSLRKFAMNFNKLLFKHENVWKIAGKQLGNAFIDRLCIKCESNKLK